MAQKKLQSPILPAKTATKTAAKSAPKASAKTSAKNVVKTVTSKVKIKLKPQQSGKNTVTSNRLKLLVTIVSRNKSEFYTDLIQSFDVNMQCVLLGQGTADKSMLGLLGLTESDKAVILSVIQEQKISEALSVLENKFETIKDGKGVACTLPLTSVIGALIYGFLSNNRETVKEANNGKQ